MSAAAGALGLRYDIVKAARVAGCAAFRANGTVHLAALKRWLKSHPEIARSLQDLPNKQVEQALKLRAERQLAEMKTAEAAGQLVRASQIMPTIEAVGRIARQRMLQIPDRMHQLFALKMQKILADAYIQGVAPQAIEPLDIKDMLATEIKNALRSLAEYDVKQVLADIAAQN